LAKISMTYCNDRRSAVDQGASTLVLVSLLAMTGSLLIILWPYPFVSRVLTGHGSWFDFLVVLSSSGAPIWLLVLLYFKRRVQAQMQARLLRYGRLLEQESVRAGLRATFQQERIALFLLGDPDKVSDPGGKIVASPRVVRAYELRPYKHVLLFPALAYTRLSGDPEALDAVLAHEVAHVLHRDLRILGGLDELLQATLWFVPLAIGVSFIGSVVIDIRAGAEAAPAVLASLLGKSSVLVLPLLILASLAVLRLVETYREALADAFASEVVGAAALSRAERKLIGDDANSRAWRRVGLHDLLHASSLAGMFGFTIGAFSGYLPSPFAYWHSILVETSWIRLPVHVAFVVSSTIIIYAGAYSLSRILTSSASSSIIGADDALKRLALFGVFVVLGSMITQTLPLMLSAAPIFDQFTNISRHYARPLFVASLAETVTLVVSCTVVGAICALSDSKRETVTWGLVGAITVAVGQIEGDLFPQYTLGLASFVIGSILLGFPARNALRYVRKVSPITLAIPLFSVLLVIGSWFGLGGPGCLAASLDGAASFAVSRNEFDRAITLTRAATYFAPLTPSGFLRLAKLQLRQDGLTDDAVVSAERALHAPYLNSWNEHFETLVVDSTARLKRRHPSDWSMASTYLASARDLWRRNDRLDKHIALILYYDSAIVSCHDDEVLMALTYFLTALAYADKTTRAEAANQAMGESDLQCLGMSDGAKPKRSALEFFMAHRGTVDEAVHDALREGISQEEVMRVLRLSIRGKRDSAGA
jgi:Zn-dependent protease with chaperone function